MRLLGLLGLLLTGCLLVGCGGDERTASDAGPATTSASASAPVPSPGLPTPTESGSASTPAPETTRILSETAAGGTTSTAGVELVDDAAVTLFTEQFTSSRLSDKVRRAVASTDVAAGQRLYGAVIAVGCDVPKEVVVSLNGSSGSGGSGVEITAIKVSTPRLECFAPVTSVALVLLNDG